MIENRTFKLLKEFQRKQNFTINELTIYLDCSNKTVVQELKYINRQLKANHLKSEIQIKPRIGVTISPYDPNDFEALIAKHKNSEINEADMIYEILRILFDNEYTKTDTLIDAIGVSKGKLTQLLNEIREQFKPYNLELNTRPHYGLYIAGDEENIRKFIFEYLISTKKAKKFYKDSDINFTTLDERIIIAIKNYQVNISDIFVEHLLLLTHICAMRLLENHIIANSIVINNTSKYELGFIRKIVSEIEEFTNIKTNENELNFFTQFIQGNIAKKEPTNEDDLDDSYTPKIIGSILKMIHEKYQIDLTNDITLYTSLTLHLKLLLKRVNNDSFSVNPIKDEIKAQYLLAYDIAIDASELLKKQYSLILNDDEVSYLAVYLHLAYERLNKETRVLKKILVVCPAGKGISQLIATKIKDQFSEYISIVDTCAYYELDDCNCNKYDFIFTYKPIDIDVSIPVIQMPLLSDEDELHTLKRKLIGKTITTPPLLELTNQGLFFPCVEADNREEAINWMIKSISQYIPLNNKFKEGIDKREECFATELDNQYAFPHPILKDAADISFLAIGVLKKPIIWSKKKVRIVLMGYIKPDESKDLQHFYRSFAKLVTNKQYAYELIESPTYETIEQIALNIQKEIY